MNLYTIIIAGGIGSRVESIFGSDYPKQFIILPSVGFSSFMNVVKRAQVKHDTKILIVTNKKYFDIACAQTKQVLGSSKMPEVIFILEPFVYNTFAAILLTLNILVNNFSLRIDNTILILPSDHIILDEGNFYNDILQASKIVNSDLASCIMFGIMHHCTDIYKLNTQYGHLICGKAYIDSDMVQYYSISELKINYHYNNTDAKPLYNLEMILYNSGIFFGKCDFLFETCLQYLVSIGIDHSHLTKHIKQISTNTFLTNENDYTALPKIQFDNALCAHIDNIKLIKANFDWIDIGSPQNAKKVMLINP